MLPHTKKSVTLGSPLAGNLMLLTITFVWGATFVFVKSGFDQFNPFTFLSLRFWIAFVVLVIFLRNRLWQGGIPCGGLVRF